MFIDNIEIYVKAGDGGNGAVSFHREKYVSAGGPDGGDGGRGGNVILRVDEGANTLLAFRYKRKFIAEGGGNGMAGKMHGKNGSDVIIPVPRGTLIREKESGRIIFDMASADEYVLCKGRLFSRAKKRIVDADSQAAISVLSDRSLFCAVTNSAPRAMQTCRLTSRHTVFAVGSKVYIDGEPFLDLSAAKRS